MLHCRTCSDVSLLLLQEFEKWAVLQLLLPAPGLLADVSLKATCQLSEGTDAAACGGGGGAEPRQQASYRQFVAVDLVWD